MLKNIVSFFSKKKIVQNYNRTHVQLGKDYETIAVRYLKKQGYKIIKRNFHSRFGEIDIIAKHKEYTCFIEVKGRVDSNYGDPQEFVVAEKIKRIRKTAAYYVMKNNLEDSCIRFDVLSIKGGIEECNIEFFEAAFDYED